LTLRVQLHHRVKYLRSVPATVFLPRPDVDSAVVRLEPRDPIELPEHDDELLLKLIRIGFLRDENSSGNCCGNTLATGTRSRAV
jgi:16S rRNA (adenine1518-N6/adenine1519-N6)-dimethyltransferase